MQLHYCYLSCLFCHQQEHLTLRRDAEMLEENILHRGYLQVFHVLGKPNNLTLIHGVFICCCLGFWQTWGIHRNILHLESFGSVVMPIHLLLILCYCRLFSHLIHLGGPRGPRDRLCSWLSAPSPTPVLINSSQSRPRCSNPWLQTGQTPAHPRAGGSGCRVGLMMGMFRGTSLERVAHGQVYYFIGSQNGLV